MDRLSFFDEVENECEPELLEDILYTNVWRIVENIKINRHQRYIRTSKNRIGSTI